jgi:asparagine synthase (glutamine-hydrolysing)
MCGISGIVDFSGVPVEPKRVVDMTRAIEHRGPDGEGAVFFFADGSWTRKAKVDDFAPAGASTVIAALAHRRLAIIDLSERGAQPMVDDSGDYWITFNGEIYNYIELKQQLESKGYKFRSSSDTEVILHAYKEWGADCLRQFNGMFAFAIWEVRKRRLFCARDPLGIKPFYYRFKANRLLFASEQKSLVAAQNESLSANVAAMADYLSFSFVPSTSTMFQGIERLAPGHFLMASSAGVQVSAYWDPTFDAAGSGREEDLVDELRALLDDAIRLQIRSDVPVGAHLSGGIDSSAVCCLAAKHLPKLLTFTARFAEGGAYDESAYARIVATRIGSDHHEIVPKGSALPDLLRKIIYHLDEPVEAASVFGKYHVAEIVSRSVKVVLGGQGGDELFGGYDWYVKDLFTLGLFAGLRNAPGRPQASFMLETLKAESKSRLAKSVWKNFGVSRLDQIFCRNWSRFTQAQLASVFNQGVVSEAALASEARFLAAFDRLREREDGDRMFKFDLQHYLQALLTSEDRLSMAFSIESRVPLLDHRIAELAGRIGYAWKTFPGRTKFVLRRALEGVIPIEILERKDKRGFPTPIGIWLADPKLKLLETFVLNGSDFARKYFDLRRVRKLAASHAYGSTDKAERLWRILTLCVWGQVFNVS